MGNCLRISLEGLGKSNKLKYSPIYWHAVMLKKAGRQYSFCLKTWVRLQLWGSWDPAVAGEGPLMLNYLVKGWSCSGVGKEHAATRDWNLPWRLECGKRAWPDMAVPTFKGSTEKTEAGWSLCSWGQPGLPRETLSQSKSTMIKVRENWWAFQWGSELRHPWISTSSLHGDWSGRQPWGSETWSIHPFPTHVD